MSEFRRRLLAKKDELKENEILAAYDVNSIDSETRILGNTFDSSNLVRMYIDGHVVNITKTYTFNTIGEHIVKFIFKENTTTLRSLFSGCARLLRVNLSNFDASLVLTMEYTFNSCSIIREIDLSCLVLQNLLNFNHTFSNAIKLEKIILPNMPNVTTMYSNISNCPCIVIIDYSNIDAINVTDFGYILSSTPNIVNFIPFKNWRVGNLDLSPSKVSALSVHQLILESVVGSSRTLKLNQTTKTNWQNSEYYEADQAMATEKLITIQ